MSLNRRHESRLRMLKQERRHPSTTDVTEVVSQRNTHFIRSGTHQIQDCLIPSLRPVALHGPQQLPGLGDACAKGTPVKPWQVPDIPHLDSEIFCERLAGLACMVDDVLRFQIEAEAGSAVVDRCRPQPFQGVRVVEYPGILGQIIFRPEIDLFLRCSLMPGSVQ